MTERRSGSRSVSRQNSDGSFKKGGSVTNISESEGYPSDKVITYTFLNCFKSDIRFHLLLVGSVWIKLISITLLPEESVSP